MSPFPTTDLTQNNEVEALIRASEDILAVNPNFSDVRKSLGNLYFVRGQQYLAEAQAANDPGLLEKTYQCWNSALKNDFFFPSNETYFAFQHLALQFGGKKVDEFTKDFVTRLLEMERQSDKSPEQLAILIKRGEALLVVTSSDVELKHRVASWLCDHAQSVYYQKSESEDPSELDLAISEWKRALELVDFESSPEWIDIAYKAVHASHWQGNQGLASWFVARALEMQEQLTAKHPLARTNIRFLQTRTCTLSAYGHLIGELEFFAKMKKTGICPPYKGVILAPRDKVISIPALNQWQRFGLAVTEPKLVTRLEKFQKHLEYNSYWLKMPAGKVVHSWSGFVAAQQPWEDASGGPIYSFSKREVDRGYSLLEELGIPRGAWYVAMIVRDTFIQQGDDRFKPVSASQRDAKIETYSLAMREIIERGGWIVRLGDKNMPPMQKSDRVIDYAHSPLKTPWLDLFVVAKSQFLLGTASGPTTVAVPFAIPSILTNISPAHGLGIQSTDLYLPKLLWSEKEHRVLSFKETLAPPYYYCVNNNVYNKLGVKHIDNTPEELREITIEMIHRLEDRRLYDESDELLQRKFKEIISRNEACVPRSRIGRDFLRRYSNLLD